MQQSTTRTTSFVDVLRSEGPLQDQKEKMTMYNGVMGDWEIDMYDYAADGTRKRSTGDWHFSWVLEGRAIQDVFIVPSRTERQNGSGDKVTRYGTTVRVYDPKEDVWHITWINPVNGAHNVLVGRKQGDDILQEGKNPDGSLIRWTFSDIRPNSFRWRGEVSTDEGKTWRLVVEFFARRTVAAGAGK